MTDDGPIILYGAPQSLYAGRARSYMIKAGPFLHVGTHAVRV